MNLRHSDFTVNIPNQPYHFLVRVTSTSVKILPCHDKDLPNDNYKIMASVDSLKQLVEDLDTKINNNPSLLGKNARLLLRI